VQVTLRRIRHSELTPGSFERLGVLLLVEETDLAWFGGVYPFAESSLSKATEQETAPILRLVKPWQNEEAVFSPGGPTATRRLRRSHAARRPINNRFLE
jgi:hypothetical protein